MNINESLAILQRLIDQSEGVERACYKAEHLGYDCVTLGIAYDPAMFLDARMEKRYEQGYADAQAKAKYGEGLTLSPVEVLALQEVL